MQRCVGLGLEMRHEDYMAAIRLGETCRAQLDAVFDDLDVLLTPCTNGEAPVGLGHTGDPGFQAIWTILHVPAISLPTHRGPTGLPVGIQLIAPKYKDEHLVACARWTWQRLRPE
jgi:amidase